MNFAALQKSHILIERALRYGPSRQGIERIVLEHDQPAPEPELFICAPDYTWAVARLHVVEHIRDNNQIVAAGQEI